MSGSLGCSPPPAIVSGMAAPRLQFRLRTILGLMLSLAILGGWLVDRGRLIREVEKWKRAKAAAEVRGVKQQEKLVLKVLEAEARARKNH